MEAGVDENHIYLLGLVVTSTFLMTTVVSFTSLVTIFGSLNMCLVDRRVYDASSGNKTWRWFLLNTRASVGCSSASYKRIISFTAWNLRTIRCGLH